MIQSWKFLLKSPGLLLVVTKINASSRSLQANPEMLATPVLGFDIV